MEMGKIWMVVALGIGLVGGWRSLSGGWRWSEVLGSCLGGVRAEMGEDTVR